MKVLSLLLTAGFLALANAHGCPPLWTNLGADCYRFFGFPRPWRIAERVCTQFTSCSAQGTNAVAHLASVVDAKQLTYLFNKIESHAPELPPAPVWIGLTDSVTEGDFRWTDGKPYIFRAWERGHPNNNQNADCVAMPGERPGSGWVTFNCNEELAYMCKMPAGEEQGAGTGTGAIDPTTGQPTGPGPYTEPPTQYLQWPDYLYYY